MDAVTGLGMLVLALALSLWRSFCVATVWNWYAGPLWALRDLRIAEIWVATLLWALFQFFEKGDDGTPRQMVERALVNCIVFAIILAEAWAARFLILPQGG